MPKFKVGDEVVCTKYGMYLLTRPGVKCIVKIIHANRIFYGWDMEVTLPDSPNPENVVPAKAEYFISWTNSKLLKHLLPLETSDAIEEQLSDYYASRKHRNTLK